MDVHLEDLGDEKRYEVKLQIELYNLAMKVIVEERRRDFEEYMEERKEKIRKILGTKHGKIYEGGEVIFSF